MSPIDEIQHDLDWRESELAVLKILLSNRDLSEREKLVLFRAAWALLYAHYEGFCKFALTVFYDAVKLTGKVHGQLPKKMQVFSLEKSIKLIRNLPSEDFIESINSFEIDFMEKLPEFPEVDTQSNLWPRVLQDLLDCASVKVNSLDNHNVAIRTLVNRRNKIAHGEKDMIQEYSYYIGFDDAVRNIMYDLAISIHERLEELS